MKQINYKFRNFTKISSPYDNAGVYKLKCNCDSFYTDKKK